MSVAAVHAQALIAVKTKLDETISVSRMFSPSFLSLDIHTIIVLPLSPSERHAPRALRPWLERMYLLRVGKILHCL